MITTMSVRWHMTSARLRTQAAEARRHWPADDVGSEAGLWWRLRAGPALGFCRETPQPGLASGSGVPLGCQCRLRVSLRSGAIKLGSRP